MSKLIVLSVDAMVGQDVALLKTLPNYKRYLSGGAEISQMRSIYPTVTYPCHVTMSTGCFPDRHGIISNTIFSPGGTDLPWHWYADAVKVPDLFTAAKQSGLRTAAVFWPVTGNHPHIDYLIDEYWTQGPDDTLLSAFARTGSSEAVLEIVRRHAPLMVERTHPMCDNFIIACGCDILRQFQPDLLMLHPANIDGYRHSYGLFNEQVEQGVYEADRWIGELMDAAAEAGGAEETSLVLVSDHGQLDIKRVVNLNVIFADQGLLETDAHGRLKSWEAYLVSNGLSAQVYLNNAAKYDKVYRLLQHLCEEGLYGISRVYTREEIQEHEHVSGSFSFMLETDGYTSFGEALSRPVVSSFDLTDFRAGRASHGHHPDKGPQPVFLAKGPAFRSHVTLARGRIVDEAPTFAKALGIDLPHTDGRALTEILKTPD